MTRLPTPDPGRKSAISFVAEHLGHLLCDRPASGSDIAGGQSAADAALAAFDVAGYASDRNQVWPKENRGASRLSPYIRHGLLHLPTVWAAVADGPDRDVAKFRDELLWQEYARHLYARLGRQTASPLRAKLDERSLPPTDGADPSVDEAWRSQLPCVSTNVDELTETGWLVNQARMWLSSHWTVRHGRRWTDGEDFFFRHLLDGSRAANRLGWQWTTGVGAQKPYGFSRWQVEKRAPGWCAGCALSDQCPIQAKPSEPVRTAVRRPPGLLADRDPATTAGPAEPTAVEEGVSTAKQSSAPAPDRVWLTAESLGLADPALTAHPALPVVFVFDEALLARLRLSSKRLVFLTETLSELATVRTLELHLGDPVAVLAPHHPTVTFAPVPGFRSRVAGLPTALLHPWPWLITPHANSVQSFSAWRRAVGV